MSDFDVVVVGAGVAGLTAARDAAAGGARVLVIDKQGLGGQVSTVEDITNAPGRSEPVAGYDLGVDLLEVAEESGAEITLAEISSITPVGGGFELEGADEPIRARSVIVAAGSDRRALGVPGEREFEGQGVSRCASCDGPFFRGKPVVVVGGGDSAFDEARVLAEFASEVLVVHSGAAPTAREEIAAPTLAHGNVRLVPEATVTGIRGEGGVASVTIRGADEESEVSASGVFVYIGLEPHTAWLSGLVDLDENGRIAVGDDLASSRPGVFAAGDVRSGSAAMLAESAADGERAAAAALAYLAGARSADSPAAS